MLDFHSRNRTTSFLYHIDLSQCIPLKAVPDAVSSKNASRVCTKSGHALVDGLHSIENTVLTNPYFSLTGKIEGVEQDRSLTAS